MSPLSSYSFYDGLRQLQVPEIRPIQPEQPGRSLHVARVNQSLGNDDDSVTLCHIPIFLRYTEFNEHTNLFDDVSSLSFGGTAGALLAMHHFNNGNGSIVPELDNIHTTCDIRFTTEVIDTQSSPIVAVQNLANMITRSPTNITHPQPCAVMGAAWYTVSQSMATLTGVYDLLQVSPSSSSLTLDSMAQYPLFSRTHPSDEAKGKLAVQYFDHVLQTRHFGILYMNSESNIALQKKVAEQAAVRNMTTQSVAVAGATSLREALLELKETKLNYFLGVFFPLSYDHVMEVAAEVGVAGPGKFWLMTGHLADSFAIQNTTIRNQNAKVGSTGLAILHDDGYVGLPQYDKFYEHWQGIQHDPELVAYINSKQPALPNGFSHTFDRPSSYFGMRPSHYASFSYDAVAGMGLAACRASQTSKKPDRYFTGKEHHASFVNHSFMGVTGNVTFGSSFSRDGDSVYYFISEIHEIDQPEPGVSVFTGRTSMYFDTDSRQWYQWPNSPDYIYADGTAVPPPELPASTEDTNKLTTAIRATSWSLAATVILTSVALSTFVFVKRKDEFIVASQPPFLYFLCAGTLVMGIAILLLTIDDAVTSDTMVSVACMSSAWFISIGFTITFAALFSKTWRINKLVRMSRRLARVTITAKDVMVPFLILFSCNVLILSLWTAFAPLQWERQILEVDEFGRTLESVGQCRSDGWLPYGIALFLVDGTALLLAISEAYRAREIATDFSESKYIAMAVLCIFQAMFFGIPLFALAEKPTAQVFVMAALIFVICMAVMLLIFVPKFLAIRQKEARRLSGSSVINSGPEGQNNTRFEYGLRPGNSCRELSCQGSTRDFGSHKIVKRADSCPMVLEEVAKGASSGCDLERQDSTHNSDGNFESLVEVTSRQGR